MTRLTALPEILPEAPGEVMIQAGPEAEEVVVAVAALDPEPVLMELDPELEPPEPEVELDPEFEFPEALSPAVLVVVP